MRKQNIKLSFQPNTGAGDDRASARSEDQRNVDQGVSKIPVNQLREAVLVWRAQQPGAGMFGPGFPSIYDRVDELIDEIERLRVKSGESKS
jgi:hypothetical protein